MNMSSFAKNLLLRVIKQPRKLLLSIMFTLMTLQTMSSTDRMCSLGVPSISCKYSFVISFRGKVIFRIRIRIVYW